MRSACRVAATWLAAFACHAVATTVAVKGSCYTDQDCMFHNKDSSGLVTGEVVGTCVVRSESLSMCKCLPAYTGKNCEFKRCPVAQNTGFMCNGVQGEGKDYYAPVKGAQQGTSDGSGYMGSEWNTYDQVLLVDNHIQSYLSTSGWVSNNPAQSTYNLLHRGPHKVGGLCDFNTGKCKCHPTYFGAACDIRTCPLGFGHNQLTKSTCSGQGDCITERAGQESVCKCNENFFGLDCSLRHCPNSTRGYQCDNHGSCDHPTGFCRCETGYYGPACEYKRCPVVNGRVCNGQGTCHASTAEATVGTKSWSIHTVHKSTNHKQG